MAPKRTVNVRGQKHSLAYINDQEKRMLRKGGGSGKPGPSGVPTYYGFGMHDDQAGQDRFDDAFGPDNDSGADEQGDALKTAQVFNNADADKVAARPPPVKGLAAKTPIGAIANAIAKGVRGKIEKELRAGGIAVKNKKGEVMGVMHDGPFGLGKVYSGRTMAAEDYAGPEEFRNNVTLDGGRDNRDENVRGGAANKVVTPQDLVDGKVNLPDAPTGGEGGDATDSAKKLSKMGKESTISTTSQGLLGSAKTRNRSLMSGLIS